MGEITPKNEGFGFPWYMDPSWDLYPTPLSAPTPPSAVSLVQGSFELDLDGASEDQVVEAATQALAASLNLDPSAVAANPAFFVVSFDGCEMDVVVGGWWGLLGDSGLGFFGGKQVLGWLDGDGLVKVASNLCRLDGCWIEKEVDNSKSFIFWFCCFVYRFLWQLFFGGF